MINDEVEKVIRVIAVSLVVVAFVVICGFFVAEGCEQLEKSRFGLKISYWLSEPNEINEFPLDGE